jgi:predicted Fe-Mo cluster-binding NifX family protein
MKVAFSSSGTDLDANVDPRFGRCPYFIIYNTDSDAFEVLDNESRQAMGGAGIQAGQAIAKTGAAAVITGNVGPNAHRVLSASKIDIYTGVSGKISEAIDRFKKGELNKADAPNVQSHYGMGGKE